MKKLISHINKTGRALLLLALLAAGLHTATAQTVYSFSTCGATGQFGPTQAQANTAYASTNLAGNVTVSSGIQQWTVPLTGLYGFTVAGSSGGGSSGTLGCRGRIVYGETNLTSGQVLKILVGQKGDYVTTSAGGGGGSFVSTLANSPIIVGGGGGGFYSPLGSAVPSSDAPYTNSGLNSLDGSGTGGTGGNGGTGSNNGWGGGGGGFTSNGSAAVNCSNTGGLSFTNGGNGGGTCNNTNGGFGCGGGTHGNSGGGGGGGGYSGGGGSNQNISPNAGGGGGSFQMAGMQNTADLGLNTGQGYVIIKRLCNVSLNSSTNPICAGQSLTLTTDAASNITWSNGSTSNSIVISPSVSTTYSITGTSTANCVASAAMIVTVNPLPVLSTISTPTTLCVGRTGTIMASGASTYTWSGGLGSAASATAGPAVTTTYNLNGASQFGCLSSIVVTVNVNSNTLTVNPSTTICAGTSFQLSASGGVTYTWSTGSSFASVPVSPATNTTYVVNATDMYNCPLSNTVALTVNQKPPVTVSANKSTICKGESVTLTAAGATTYSWSNNSSGSPISVVLPVDVGYSYTVTGTDASGCTNTAVVNVTANKCVGIQELSQQALGAKVYPSPTSSQLTIELNNGQAKQVEVLDLSGRVVLSTTFSNDSMQLNVDTLTNGVYFVKLKSQEHFEILKFVKQAN